MIKKYVLSCGHGKYVRGAVDILDEVHEAGRIVERVDAILKEKYDGDGYTYYDQISRDQTTNLRAITAFHNSKMRALDISIHFNAGRRNVGTGVEVLHYGRHAAVAAKLSSAMAEALGLRDRGQKVRKDLYILRKMTQPTLLLEVCFVSNREDATAYHQHFERLCQAIAQCVADYLGYRRQKATVAMPKKTLGTIKTLVHHLNYYDAPRWQQPKGVLAKGTVLTVVARQKVGSAYQYQTVSGTYVTASTNYVEFKKAEQC